MTHIPGSTGPGQTAEQSLDHLIAEAESASDTRRRRRRRPRPLVVVLVLALLAGLGAGTGWLVGRFVPRGSLQDPPTVVSIVDFSMVGDGEQIEATGDPVLRSGSTAVMRLRDGERDLLSAVDVAGLTSYPRWTAPLPANAGPCALDGTVVRCGEGFALDVDRGRPQASGGNASAPTSPGSSTPAPRHAPSVPTAASSSTPASAASGNATSAPGSATPAPVVPGSATLAGAASDQVPYALGADGSVTDRSGAVVSGLRLGSPAWVLPAQAPRSLGAVPLPGKRDVWVVCDGTTLAALEGADVLWTVTLPEGTAQVSGFTEGGSPHWLVGDTLVVGTPSGVVARDLADGSESWRVDVPLRSWTSDDQYLYLWSHSSLSVADLTRPVDASVTQVTAVAQHQGEPDRAPSAEELRNATLEVPERCGLRVSPSQASEQGRERVTFVDGQASGGSQQNARTTMKEVVTTVFEGRPAAVVRANCSYGGAYEDDFIMVYDPDHKLVAALDPVPHKQELGGSISDFTITSLSVFGGSLHLSWNNIALYGDEDYHASRKSGSADGDFVWDGQRFVATDLVFHTGQGDVRLPRLEAVQDFVDAVVAHDDARAAQWAVPSLMSALDRNAPYSGFTVRESYFPKGSTVGECILLPAVGSPNMLGMSTVYFGNGRKASIRAGDASQIVQEGPYRSGDIMCGLDRSADHSDRFGTWIMLRGRPDGSVEVYTPGPGSD